ncbi:hypothetical protein AAF712_015447 [Marasmius tenuissimus]|uniref:NAD(P)-binding domain-containing protein n=1 Tax=Marasmius tenuissimus TaxID=585030 RepID=A0ABR2Z9A9_9AGAR
MATPTDTKTALIVGATGQTGGHLLKELLASPHFNRVYEYGRRLTNVESLTEGKEKLEQKKIDFDKLEEDGSLKGGNWDVVFITLGTSRANAGSAEAFEKIDRDSVAPGEEMPLPSQNSLNRPDTYFERQRKLNPAIRRVLNALFIAPGGANMNSHFLYPRSKGLTEHGLALLGYSDTIIFRPGLLVGTERPQHRMVESAFGVVTGFLSYFSSSFEIKVATLGKAMANTGFLGTGKLPPQAQATEFGKEGAKFTLIGNSGALELAKLEL